MNEIHPLSVIAQHIYYELNISLCGWVSFNIDDVYYYFEYFSSGEHNVDYIFHITEYSMFKIDDENPIKINIDINKLEQLVMNMNMIITN